MSHLTQCVPRRSMISSKLMQLSPMVGRERYPRRRRAQGDCGRARRSPKSPAMALRDILIHPDPRLKKVAEPVPDDHRTRSARLADDMLETMYDAPGIGLAAPQVGVNRPPARDGLREGRRRGPAPDGPHQPRDHAGPREDAQHLRGRLPVDPRAVRRRDAARRGRRSRWTGLDGKRHQERFDGLWATCVQHEIDHLNGTLFIDHLTALKRQLITRKMVKLKREKARA